EVRARSEPSPPHRIDGASRCRWRQRRDGVLLFAAPEERPGPQALADPRGAPDRDHYLDRADLSPPPQAGPPGPIDPHRIRDHHEPGREPRGLTPQLSPDRAAVPVAHDIDACMNRIARAVIGAYPPGPPASCCAPSTYGRTRRSYAANAAAWSLPSPSSPAST